MSATLRRIAVAGWEVTLLDLGAIHAPLTWVRPDAPEDELSWLPCGGLLCRRDDEVVLVDCGLGPYRGIFGLDVRHVGLPAALADAGCASQDVDTVVLTHLDADHAGGVVTRNGAGGLRPALDHARVVVLDEAVAILDGTAEQRSELAEDVRAALSAASVAVEGQADGDEVVPGLRVRAAPGHRVGHICLELSDLTGRFVYLADVVHAREHVEHPEWDFLHDSDAGLGLDTRRRWIDELADTGAVVACSHVDGFGRIERRPDGSAVWVDVA